MLLGGGGLLLLLLCGGGITYLLFSESGDERLEAARTAFEAGSYTQAIQDYEQFLENFAGHDGESLARVTLGIARIRALPVSNSEQRLAVAKQEIPQIETEEAFASVKEDLASLLPAIARGLADRADAATELDEIKQQSDATRDALVLCANSNYIPSQLRDQRELDEIERVLARIERRQIALEELAATIANMATAVEQGDTRTAYATHAEFVRAHPEKAGDAKLLESVAAASRAEQDGIRYVEERIDPLTAEAKTAVTAAVATAELRVRGRAPSQGVAVVQFQGVVYALNRSDGRLLWRRPVDVATRPVEPLLIGDDCLLADARRKELVRVNAQSGKLVWRVPLDDEFAQPAVLGDRLLVAGASGRLHVVDAASGARVGYVQFAQPLRSGAAVAAEAGRVFLVGEHSSVYTLDADSLNCLGVYYLGHAKGTVATRPAVVLNRVLVAENDGATTSSLHVFGLDENGVVAQQLMGEDRGESRLSGLVTRVPQVFGKRFAVTTDNGYISVYEASAEDGQAAITQLAIRDSRRRARSTRYTAVVNEQLWIAGTGLARYSVQPSGNRLPAQEIDEPFRGDTFVSPLRTADDVVVHVRRRRGRVGATVAATDTKTGSVYWQTDIAVPAAGRAGDAPQQRGGRDAARVGGRPGVPHQPGGGRTGRCRASG